MRIELQLSNRTVDLARENFDMALRMTPQPPQDCSATPVLHFDIRARALVDFVRENTTGACG